MPKSPKQKQKLLYIAEYLWKNTDENHVVTTPMIIEHLSNNGIKSERKSIYDDIETLQDFGMDIEKTGGPRGGYYLASRDFELAEVKLLVDIVQSSKFITTKKSRELIGKLEGLASAYEGKLLHRQVVVADRNKTDNETIYYSVDLIYEAIAGDNQIRFKYFDWDENKAHHMRKNGEYYQVSPWLLTWEDENYYLMAYDEGAGILKHYRVDKMLKLEVVEERRTGKEVYEKIDVAAFSKRTFGMFAGDERMVNLIADKSMTGVMVDRFGLDVALRKYDEDYVKVHAKVAISPQFYGWVAGLSGKVVIEGPEDVVAGFKEYLQGLLEGYK